VVKACFVHSRGCISPKLSAKIIALTTSSCSISPAVLKNAMVDAGDFQSSAAKYWSRGALCTPAVWYIIIWQTSASIRLYSHLIMRYVRFLLLPIWQTIFNGPCWVIVSVAAFAGLRWTKCCLCCSWVLSCGVLDEAPLILPGFDPLGPSWGVCDTMIWLCGSEEMIISKRSGKFWGWWSLDEVGSPEEYIVSCKSEWNA